MKYLNIPHIATGVVTLLTVCSISLMTGCSSDKDTDLWEKDPQAIRIAPIIGEHKPVSRIADGESSSTWENNDAITVREVISGRSVSYIYNGSLWQPATEGSYLRWEERTTGQNSFIAWHPADDNKDGYTTFELPTDQSSSITSADWMTAQATLSQSNDRTLPLTFHRKMSKVTMVIESWNEQFAVNDPITSFLLKSTSSEAEEDTPDHQPTNITPLNNGKTQLPPLNAAKEPLNKDDCPHYTAIVFPTDAQPSAIFMTCKVNGYDLALTGIPKLEVGIHYTYYLTVGKAAVTVSNVRVNDWETGKDITGDAPEQF